MKKIFACLLLSSAALVMIYPLLWLLGASFKTNDEIFSSIWFMPPRIEMSVYGKAWQTVTPYTMGHYFLNTFKIIIPKTAFTVLSSVLVAYGFARFDFPFRRLFFALLMCSMFMPSIVTLLPTYLMWNVTGLINTYVPLTLPAISTCPMPNATFSFGSVSANS